MDGQSYKLLHVIMVNSGLTTAKPLSGKLKKKRLFPWFFDGFNTYTIIYFPFTKYLAFLVI
jgi:hypothetical protein